MNQAVSSTLRDLVVKAQQEPTFRADVMVVRALRTGEPVRVLLRTADGSFRAVERFYASAPDVSLLN